MSAAVAPPASPPLPADETAAIESSAPHYVPLRDAAAKIHSSLKDSNYSLVRLGVGLADSLTSTAYSLVPEPVVNKVNALSAPLIDAADAQLEQAFNKLQPVAQQLASKVTGKFHSTVDAALPSAQALMVPQEWFHRVDDIIREQGGVKRVNTRLQISSTSDLQPLLQSYYMTASFQFLALARRGTVNEAAFLSALKESLVNIWNDQLREPSLTFHHTASSIYASTEDARSLTPTPLLERMKPLLGTAWEDQTLAAFKGSVEQPSALIYVSALQQYQSLSLQAKQTGMNLLEIQRAFITSMQTKLGAAYSTELQEPLNELITRWTEQAKSKHHTLSNSVYDRYQYLLLSAQQVFDRVLPPVVDAADDDHHAEEEEKQPAVEEEDYIAEPPRSLRELASHVKDRVGERGVVNNVATASTNSVKEGVHLAANVAHQGVKVASNVASSALSTAHNVVRPVVDPVITRVSPIVQPLMQPYVDSARAQAKPVVDAVQQRQLLLQQQVQTAYNSTKIKIEQIQALLKQLSSDMMHNTKDTIRNTATNAANTISANIPSTIHTRITELQQKLQAAASYAQQLKQEGQQYVLQQQITQLSLSYAEVAKAIVQQQLHALQNNLNAEKLAALAEEAKISVTQLILYTRKQLALEHGESDEDVREEEAAQPAVTATVAETTTNTLAEPSSTVPLSEVVLPNVVPIPTTVNTASVRATAAAPNVTTNLDGASVSNISVTPSVHSSNINTVSTAAPTETINLDGASVPSIAATTNAAPFITTHLTTPTTSGTQSVVNVTSLDEPGNTITKKVVVTTTTIPASSSSHPKGKRGHHHQQQQRGQREDQEKMNQPSV